MSIHQVNQIKLAMQRSFDLYSSLEGPSINKRSQSIQSRTAFNYGLTNNHNIHHCPPPSSTSKTSPHLIDQTSTNILRHITSPSFDFTSRAPPYTMSLSRSSFGRNHIRKKQPRTNPNYINIRIQTHDGSVRSTYIRVDDLSKCQALTVSSTSSTSSSEQDSILDYSQSYSNDSNGYFPSDETISTDRAHLPQANSSTMHRSVSTHTDHLQTLPSKTSLKSKRLIMDKDG